MLVKFHVFETINCLVKFHGSFAYSFVAACSKTFWFGNRTRTAHLCLWTCKIMGAHKQSPDLIADSESAVLRCHGMNWNHPIHPNPIWCYVEYRGLEIRIVRLPETWLVLVATGIICVIWFLWYVLDLQVMTVSNSVHLPLKWTDPKVAQWMQAIVGDGWWWFLPGGRAGQLTPPKSVPPPQK